MAIQPAIDASSLKPLAFHCLNISPRPFIRAVIPAASSCSLSDAHVRLSIHQRSSRRGLRISAPIAAAADSIVADEESADDSSYEVPPETEVRRFSLQRLPQHDIVSSASVFGLHLTTSLTVMILHES